MSENKKEMVNHPEHYKGNKFEVIEIIEDYNLDFNLGNAIKYILRSDKKGNKVEDIQKAIWYLNREIKMENNPKENNNKGKYIKCMSCGDYFSPENEDDLICENCKEKYVDENENENEYKCVDNRNINRNRN